MTYPLTVQVPSSSSGELYDISFFMDIGGNLKASCSCQAGRNSTMCKHVSGILNGDLDNVVFDPSSREALTHFLQTDFPRSDFAKAFREYQEAIRAAEAATKAKKKKTDALKSFLQGGYF